MNKLVVTFLVVCFSGKIFSQDWQETTFSLNSSLSTRTSSSDFYQSSLSLNVFKQHVSGPWGVRLGTELNQIYLSSDDPSLENHHTTGTLNTAGVLFLSRGNQISGKLQLSESIKTPEDDFSQTLLVANSAYKNQQQSGSVNYSKGLDNSFFVLDITASFDQQEKTYFEANQAFSRTQLQRLAMTSMWQQTESTYWGFKLESRQTESRREDLVTDYQVTNLYLSNKTRIFKRSELLLNLGQTSSDNDDRFSWDFTAQTYLTDDLDFSVNSKRTFSSSTLLNPDATLFTTSQLAFNFSFSDSITFTGQITQDIRNNQVNDDSTELNKVSAGINYAYSDRWNVNLLFVQQSQKNGSGLVDLDSQTAQISLTGAFL